MHATCADTIYKCTTAKIDCSTGEKDLQSLVYSYEIRQTITHLLPHSCGRLSVEIDKAIYLFIVYPFNAEICMDTDHFAVYPVGCEKKDGVLV